MLFGIFIVFFVICAWHIIIRIIEPFTLDELRAFFSSAEFEVFEASAIRHPHPVRYFLIRGWIGSAHYICHYTQEGFIASSPEEQRAIFKETFHIDALRYVRPFGYCPTKEGLHAIFLNGELYEWHRRGDEPHAAREELHADFLLEKIREDTVSIITAARNPRRTPSLS